MVKVIKSHRTCVSAANKTAVDLLVVLVDINLHQPSAISHCAKYNIVSLTSLIPLCLTWQTERGGGPPRVLSLVCPICTPAITRCSSQLCKYTLIRPPPHRWTSLKEDVDLENLQANAPTCALMCQSHACTGGVQLHICLFANYI